MQREDWGSFILCCAAFSQADVLLLCGTSMLMQCVHSWMRFRLALARSVPVILAPHYIYAFGSCIDLSTWKHMASNQVLRVEASAPPGRTPYVTIWYMYVAAKLIAANPLQLRVPVCSGDAADVATQLNAMWRLDEPHPDIV